jgi:hypothetical protein
MLVRPFHRRLRLRLRLTEAERLIRPRRVGLSEPRHDRRAKARLSGPWSKSALRLWTAALALLTLLSLLTRLPLLSRLTLLTGLVRLKNRDEFPFVVALPAVIDLH